MIQVEFVHPQGDPEVGENLMVKRNFCIEKIEDREPIHRRSLFKTKCKIARKCCKVIIDNGSSKKLASEELVEKL